MKSIKLISNQKEFQKEFERCCNEYSELEIFTAWVGNPGNIVPFSHLENLDSVQVHLGISFDQSNPDGIEYLMNKKYKITIIDDKYTYHPKLYFFKSKINYALLMGSSNFTYSGFYQNVETNILLEGAELQGKIKAYLSEMKLMVGKLISFIPDSKWLEEYRKKYKIRQANLKKAKVKEESVKEDKLIISSSWLATADWETYLKHINRGLRRHAIEFEETFEDKLSFLEEYKTHLRTPWRISIFQTIENRRRILGLSGYGWLGNIGASGSARQLFAKGTQQKKKNIINSINRIAKMETPINYSALQRELDALEGIGPSIKVWGRLLAITRPDIFCTISSLYVRESLSILLEKPKSYFQTNEGYVELLRLIHQSPWYNSSKPKDKREQQIWMNRVAFLDVVFYAHE